MGLRTYVWDGVSSWVETTSGGSATVIGTSPISVATSGSTATVSVSTGTTSATVATGNHGHTTYVETTGDTVTGTLTISNTGSLAVVGATSTANTQVTTKVDGDTSTRWGVRADGFQAWGDGTSSRDTNLYRSAANTLATDDNFDVGQSLTVGGDIIHAGQLDFSAGGAVAASVTSAGLYFPASKRITFEGATDDGFETLLTAADPTADRTVTIPYATGTVALTADKLSAFAATTSAELAGVISNETGTGSLVFGTSPTLDGVTLTATASTPVIHGIFLPATHVIAFEGATADAFETTITAGDPTADRTITLPDATGTVALTANDLGSFAASTSAAIGVGTIELGNLTDTTLSRSAAGTLAVEGVDVVTTSATQNLTNKTLNKVSITAPATSATLTIADGKTLTASNTLTLTGTDSVSASVGNGGSLVPPGVVHIYMGSSTNLPTGWLMCNGDAVSRTTYATLFGVIGTNFGAGDGSTTFTLPDLAGHLLVGSVSTAPGTALQAGTTDAYTTANWGHTHSHSHVTNPAATTSATASATAGGTEFQLTGSSTSGHTHSTDIAATTSDTDATSSSSITLKRTRVNYIIKW